jgi:3-deoxy-D-manno-octulosonic-acid transferase
VSVAARPVSLRLYALAAGLCAPLARFWLAARTGSGKEDPARLGERLGRPGRPRPPGRLVWLHGASVGESLALLPLIGHLETVRPDAAILVTSGTRASADLLATRLPARAIHQYAPLDSPVFAARFVGYWRPDLGVLVESELWPNLILAARAAGARLALASAKLSPASAAGWAKAPAAARAVLHAFDLVLARDAESAARLAALGARVAGLADLKFGAPILPADPGELAAAQQALGERRAVLAASTHPGEEEAILTAFAAARGADRPLLIIAPRHPARGEAVLALARAAGLAAARRGAGEGPGACEVYVADTVGEMGLWLRLARMAIIGGSLAPGGAGGHNPFEAARLGCPFVAGRHVEGWPVYAALETAGATRLVGRDALGEWIGRALVDAPELAAMARSAATFVAERDALASGAASRIIALLPP